MNNPSSWNLNLIRLTIFPTDSSQILSANPENLWTTSFDIPIERKEENVMIQRKFLVGFDGDVECQLELLPTKIQWLFKPKEDIQLTSERSLIFNTLGKIESVIDGYKQKINKIIEANSLVISRVAIGLLLQTDPIERNAAYQVMAQNLPFLKVDPSEVKEVLLQINKPIQSTSVGRVRNIEINRLTKWATTKLKGSVSNDGINIDLIESHYAQLELDINTDKENQRNLTPSQSAVVKKLFDLSEEIIEKGMSE